MPPTTDPSAGYRCEATGLAGFIQQVAVSYLKNGYVFYVQGTIPAYKDPAKTDAKIVEQYEIGVSKFARARRKQAGRANLQYLRLGHDYVIMATHGEHPFFAAEAARLRDARRAPIRVGGYAISYRRSRGGGSWHPSVRLDRARYGELKAYFEDIAPHRSAEALAGEFAKLKLECYAPVRAQLLAIWRAVNRHRLQAGFEAVPIAAVPWRRSVVTALKHTPSEPSTWTAANPSAASETFAEGP